ncbi:hypothetical protein [Salipiger mucosus]|uniref:Uncharacterized protein n=1 Tax=Salipiger mucosus DSM 16094 TaxID=1123237 RepID=S9QZC4_9RHOB|nr:hypothetical protein [Salipiger mucosus]EPX86721.1 hypothetical protein Salmuc_01198 [Salipiger mucosus DSM 16094]
MTRLGFTVLCTLLLCLLPILGATAPTVTQKAPAPAQATADI